jgi:hypothetical protein
MSVIVPPPSSSPAARPLPVATKSYINITVSIVEDASVPVAFVTRVLVCIRFTSAKAELPRSSALDVAHVAGCKAADAFAPLGEPVLVDGTGLGIHGWNV